MKHNHNHSVSRRFIGGTLVVAVIAIATVIVVLWRGRIDAVSPAKPPASTSLSSQFTFTGASGWWQGATNQTSMALFHNYDCFTSVEYKTGTVDATEELQKEQATLSMGGYTVTPTSTQALALQTATGPVEYELHQSDVTTPTGANKVEGGQEFGYVQLPKGYVKVTGHCDTNDQLASTIPALQSIKFTSTY